MSDRQTYDFRNAHTMDYSQTGGLFMLSTKQAPAPTITVTRNFLGDVAVGIDPRPYSGGLMPAGSSRKGGAYGEATTAHRAVLPPVPGGRRPDGE